MTARYTFGGDEHLLVEFSEAMSLEAFFRGISVCDQLRQADIAGVTEICPGNASIMVRFDPDRIAPADLAAAVRTIEQETAIGETTLSTRIIEMPVFYDDPWTRETLMRFRDRHQDPAATDLEYAARINGYDDVEGFIAAHSGSPWIVSMVGFVAGCPFLYQMVERERQIQVPKYVRPRTDTPRLTVGHGGCFSAIYPVRGAGGYQMFGITPMPIYDPSQQVGYLEDFMILFRPGDILKFRRVDRQEYEHLVAEIDAGRFVLKTAETAFSYAGFVADPQTCNARLLEALDGH